MKKAGSKQKRTRETPKRSRGTRARPKTANRLIASRKAEGRGKVKSSQTPPAKTAKAKREQARPQPPVSRKPTPEEIAHRNMLAQFESALKLFSANQFAKARSIFERLMAGAAPDLAQRALVYLNICNQRLARPTVQFKTADDHYNYAVQMANRGNLEEAEEHLKKALKLAPTCDYIHYALASTSALRENAEESLAHLQEAIQLNGQNRYLAQNDPDFSSLGEDPRFTELLYPERPF